jgi:hypothetical protein
MDSASTTPPTGEQASAGIGRAAEWALGALVALILIGGFLLILNLFLTFVSWKAAVGTDLLALGAAAVVWKRRSLPPFFRYVIVGATVISVVAVAAVFRTTWITLARHDERLADMVATLCEIDLPSEATVEDCGGSITNTGNGNSCRYLATALVRPAGHRSTVVEALIAQGFAPAELNVWGDPIYDGRRYGLPEEGDEIRLYLQASWRQEEGDLRCT